MSQNSKIAEHQNRCDIPIVSTKNVGGFESQNVLEEDLLSRDAGSIDLPDEFGDWKDDYANAVGISRSGEL